MPAAREWSPARSFAPPERAASFPEDGMFGAVPAKALFARHVERLSIDGLRLRRVNTETAAANREPADRRPFFWLHDVADARFRAIAVPAGASNPICWSDKDNAIAATSSDDLARAPDWQTEPRRGRAQKVNTIAD